MPMLDAFRSDIFGVTSLTAAINKLPFQPSRIGNIGIFEKRGVTTTTVLIEEQRGRLSIIPTAARGTNPNVWGGKKRQVRSFVIPHIPLLGNVFAEDVQNIRAFGTESQQLAVAQVVNDKLGDLRRSMETTHEWHRVGALHGTTADADGTVLYNWFTEFGISQQTVPLNWTSNPNSAVKVMANAARRLIEDALGNEMYTRIRAICGTSVFDRITSSQEVNHAFYKAIDSAFLRESHVRGEFDYAGVVWEEYRGKIGSVGWNSDTSGSFFSPNEIIFFPEGTTDIFQEIYGPANFVETVNTRGLPLYAKQRLMDWDMGIELHVQSNPLMICNRPGVLISLGTETGTPVLMTARESDPTHQSELGGADESNTE